jgi:hypothetical protein
MDEEHPMAAARLMARVEDRRGVERARPTPGMRRRAGVVVRRIFSNRRLEQQGFVNSRLTGACAWRERA